MTEIVLYEAQKHEHLIPSFVEVHIACTLENGQTLAYFRPPFTPARRDMMHKFWEERLALTKPGGSDEVVIAFNEDPQGEKKLSGFVQLHMPWSESGPFRGYVQTLCVSPDFRRLGIATKMMKKVDEVAKDKGRWNLVSKFILHLFTRDGDTLGVCKLNACIERRSPLPNRVLQEVCILSWDTLRLVFYSYARRIV